jgi:hypothetical protein
MQNLLRALGSSVLAAVLAVGASADTIYMRNGSVIRGTVVGYANGEFTVQMDARAGQARSRATLAGEEIERIEFEGGAGPSSGPAYTGQPDPDPVAAEPEPEPAPAPRRNAPAPVPATDVPAGGVANQSTVTVDPRTDWTNSQVRVERGSRVRITASGTVKLDPAAGKSAGPGGVDAPDRDKLVPGRPTGALIAVIGDDNDDFIFVGSQAEFIAERAGYLFLSVNEGYLRDNTGNFTARVTVEPARGTGATGATGRRGGGLNGGTAGPAPVPARRAPAPTPAPADTDSYPDSSPDAGAEADPPPAASRPAPAPSGGRTTVAREGDVVVQPTLDWTNTKLRVQRGNIVRIAASGSVDLNRSGLRSGPAGIQTQDADKLIPNSPTGGLIAVVGDDNDDFVYVGAQAEFVSQRDGVLFLSVNEGNLRDNSGSFAARVTILQTQAAAPATQAPAPQPAGGRNSSLPKPVVDDQMGGGAPAPAAPKPVPATIGAQGGQAEFTIQAKSDWTSTSIVVKKGMKIRITATGTAKLDAAGRQTATPAGIPSADPHKLVKDKPTGALLAVIGDDNSDYIFVGNAIEFTAQRDGLLFLGLNEGELFDNSGFFTVRIVVTPAGRR